MFYALKAASCCSVVYILACSRLLDWCQGQQPEETPPTECAHLWRASPIEEHNNEARDVSGFVFRGRASSAPRTAPLVRKGRWEEETSQCVKSFLFYCNLTSVCLQTKENVRRHSTAVWGVVIYPFIWKKRECKNCSLFIRSSPSLFLLFNQCNCSWCVLLGVAPVSENCQHGLSHHYYAAPLLLQFNIRSSLDEFLVCLKDFFF